MDKKDSFVFYRSFYEAIKNVPKKHQVAIYQAVFEYAFDHKEATLSGVPDALWSLIKPQLDASEKRYENAKKGGEYGKMGGRPRKTGSEKKPLKGYEEKTLNDNDNHNVNDNHNHNLNVNENQNGNGNDTLSPPNPLTGAESGSVTTPSLSDVQNYCIERGSSVDPEEFYDFYTSKGWLVGKTPMKDWKAAFRGWERNHKAKEPENRYADLDDWYRRRSTEDDQGGVFDYQPSDQGSVS